MVFSNSVFKVQKVQIWTLTNNKGVYLLIVWNGIIML